MEPQPRRTSRQALLDVAATVLARNPGASLSEIAIKAGVGRATLHRHFPARIDLIRELTLESIDAIEAAVAPLRGEAPTRLKELRHRLQAIVPLGDRFHYLRSQVWDLADDPEVMNGYEMELESMRDLVTALREEGSIAPDVPVDWVVAVMDSLVWVAWSSVQAGHVGTRQAADLAYRTLIEGLAP